MSALANIGLAAVAVLLFALLPVAMTWGWIRWIRSARNFNMASTFSWLGFCLASASGVLAVVAMVYARVNGGFPYYDPRLMRIYRFGALSSLAAILVSMVGVWRPNPLRWLSPACSLGMLLFWIVAASAE